MQFSTSPGRGSGQLPTSAQHCWGPILLFRPAHKTGSTEPIDTCNAMVLLTAWSSPNHLQKPSLQHFCVGDRASREAVQAGITRVDSLPLCLVPFSEVAETPGPCQGKGQVQQVRGWLAAICKERLQPCSCACCAGAMGGPLLSLKTPPPVWAAQPD